MGKIGAGFIDVPFCYRDGDIAVLHHTVVGTGYLGKQHFIVLFAEMVQPVLFIDFPVVDGDLGADSGVQRIKEFRIIEKDRRLILFAGDAVVNISKGKGFGKPASHLKNPIRPDALDGDDVLHGLGDGKFFLSAFAALMSVLIIGAVLSVRKMKWLLFVPSRWLRLTLFTGQLFSLCNGILQGFIVEIVRFKNQFFGYTIPT